MNNSGPVEPAVSLSDSARRARVMAARLLRFVVALALLYYVVSEIGLANLLDKAATAHVTDLVIAFLVFVLIQVIGAIRQQWLIDAQGIRLPLTVVLEVNLAARFYGLFLPGGSITALLIRVFKFTRDGAELAGVVTALFADRLLATVSLCAVGLAFWLPVQASGWWLTAFIVALAAGLIPLAVLFTHSVSIVPGRLAASLQRLAPRWWEKISTAVHRSRISGSRILIQSLVVSIIAHLIGTLGYWLIAKSLDMPLSLVAVGWVRAGMMLATLLPVTISGIGVREIAGLVLLSQFGIESDTSVTFSLLVFATMVVGVGLLGGLIEAWRWVRK